jgi:hypothetical protein
MDQFPLQPYFQKQQLLHAFGPRDLTRMQAAFNQMCLDALCLDQELKEAMAKAIVAAYDSELDEAMLLATARFLYDGARCRVPGRAWAEDVQAPPRASASS